MVKIDNVRELMSFGISEDYATYLFRHEYQIDVTKHEDEEYPKITTVLTLTYSGEFGIPGSVIFSIEQAGFGINIVKITDGILKMTFSKDQPLQSIEKERE